jgi:RNA polymerase sigma factor (sigma-70 family)
MFSKVQSDEQLIKAIKRGNRGAFAELYRRYYLLLFRVGFSILGNATLAEDTAEDFFVAVLSHPESLDETKPFKPYAFAGIRYGAINHLRSASSKESALMEEEVGAPASSSQSVSEDLMAFLKQHLTPEECSVYVLHVGYGYTFAEIGAMTDCSEDSASSRFGRAKNKLQVFSSEPTEKD